jgi:uncharacterized UBP type Zn finger protein
MRVSKTSPETPSNSRRTASAQLAASASRLIAAQDFAVPAGLNNLGATCYVNAVLQVLFSSPAFRAGLYELDASQLAHEPTRLLRRASPLHSPAAA